MKYVSLFVLFFTVAAYGASVIFSGDFVKTLKDDLKLRDTARIITLSVDPASVATEGEPGSLALRDNGSLYVKQDSGTTTNWTLMPESSLASIGDPIGSGTANSVLFLDGSSQLAQNNAAFNISAPLTSTAFQIGDVVNNLTATINFDALNTTLLNIDCTAASCSSQITLQDDTATGTIKMADSGTLQVETDGSADISFEPGGDMVLASGNNFGIAIAAPASEMHVHNPGTGSVDPFRITNGDTGTTSSDGIAIELDGTENVLLRNYENTEMQFYTNNSERLTIEADGDIQGPVVSHEENHPTTVMLGAIQLGCNGTTEIWGTDIGNWVNESDSGACNGTGDGTISIDSGFFTTAPHCTCSIRNGSAADRTCIIVSETTSAVRYHAYDTAGLSFSNVSVNIHCIGKR